MKRVRRFGMFLGFYRVVRTQSTVVGPNMDFSKASNSMYAGAVSAFCA